MKAPVTRLVLFAVLVLFASSCAFKRITRTKYLQYEPASRINNATPQELSIFAPHKKTAGRNVLLYLHGGNWNTGNKSIYSFLGSRWARKGVVAVIVDYPLSPGATSNEMAKSVAHAVQWVRDSIAAFGGDPNRIFVSGHSAGGHLAALVGVRNEYFDSLKMKNPIKGIVLIDAAGLDMYGYLKEEKLAGDHTYFNTFTHDPAIWKQQSPLYHLHANMPPMLIYRGGKTYPMIVKGNDKFLAALKSYTPAPEYYLLKGKKHIPMMTEFFDTGNPRYREIIRFMNRNAARTTPAGSGRVSSAKY